MKYINLFEICLLYLNHESLQDFFTCLIECEEKAKTFGIIWFLCVWNVFWYCVKNLYVTTVGLFLILEGPLRSGFSLSKNKRLQIFDVEQMSLVVVVFEHWVCLALYRPEKLFSERIDIFLNKIAALLFQQQKNK